MHARWHRARRLRKQATDAERHLWTYLRRRQLHGWKFRRQYPLDRYIVDFVCVDAGLVIELDGGQHADAVAYDSRRTARLRAPGYAVARYWNDDVLKQTTAVLEDIVRRLPGPV
jgi:very-short-patch-repair endonuclease